MKLVHIIPTLEIGGAEKLIIDSLEIYKSKLNHVDLIVVKKTDSPFFEELSKKFNIITLTEGSLYNPLLLIKFIKLIKNYELVHLHLFPVLYFCAFAKLFLPDKIKLVYTEHSTYNKRRDKQIFRIIEKFVYKQLNFIGCISTATKINLQKHLGYPNLQIEVINNGIDLSKFRSLNICDYSFFEESSFILIQVSSFREQKDQVTLIKSLQGLPDSIKLILVGEGKLKNDCINLTKDLNLENRIKFLGQRTDIPDLLNYSDVCVLSSHHEGFGLAVVEGMASNMPVIASNINGVREVVENYGLLFEENNVQDLTNKILKLYNDKNFYREVMNNCFERSKEFDINKMVENYVNVYKQLLNK